MKTLSHGLTALAAAGLLALALPAGAGSRQATVAGAEQAHGHLRASAALEPVGAVSAWGRVSIDDHQTGHGLVRRADILLFGLAPSTEFSVEVDGEVLSVVTTDAAGDAKIELGDHGSTQGAVPSSVPAAGDLSTAVVTDPSLATVLEGTFVVESSGGDPASPSVYEERIDLADVTGGDAAGVAKVERHADDSQQFGTWATGLTPDESYSIVVDGFTAGVVTADSSGQASLELEAPSGDNPLPPEMQPVEDLRLVEWTTSAGDTLLSGSFTGVSDQGDGEDDGESSLTGIITGFTADGFLLQLGAREITVVVTADTVFDGVASVDDLALGDAVQVEGPFDGHTLTATSVSLEDNGDDAGEEVSFKGIITAMTADGFLFQHGAKELAVVVDADTTFDGVGGLADLAAGDSVEVEGMLTGDTIAAASVSLMEEDGGGHGDAHVSWRGLVTALTDSGFFMQHGAKDIQVVVGADTTFEGVSGLADLAVGDSVEVEGAFDGTMLTASSVAVHVHGGDGGDETSGGSS